MKAAVTTGEIRKIGVQEVPTPQVEPGKVLLRTKCCSICGTDLEYLENSLAYRPGGELKAGSIVGHEYCAEVIEIGDGVSGWSVGDRATMSAIRPLRRTNRRAGRVHSQAAKRAPENPGARVR
jgi:threonine dehydrogenase-like Zn-dependent dehydrogenase